MVLAAIAVVFGVVGAFPLVYALWENKHWRTAEAVVDNITFRSIANNPRGFASIEFRYIGQNGQGYARVSRALLPGHGDALARDYAAGTRHLILLNPDRSDSAELPVTWDSMIPSLFPWCVGLVLLVFARHFWRLQ